MATAAIGVKQRFASRREAFVKSEYFSWPRRRTQYGDLFLQRLQSGKVDGIILEIDESGRKRRRRDKATRGEISEDSDDLAGVASESLDVESIVDAAVPLGAILPRGVPEERISDRRVGDLVIVSNSEIARGDAVEDHPESVEPAGSPWARRGQAYVHEFAELRDPFAEPVFDLRSLRCGVAGAERRFGERVEPRGLGQ